MNPQYWQALGGIVVACAALYGVVTVPILRLIKAESELVEERLKLLRADLKTEMTELKGEMTAMEARLNERLADKLNNHGERITRLEERRFK